MSNTHALRKIKNFWICFILTVHNLNEKWAWTLEKTSQYKPFNPQMISESWRKNNFQHFISVCFSTFQITTFWKSFQQTIVATTIKTLREELQLFRTSSFVSFLLSVVLKVFACVWRHRRTKTKKWEPWYILYILMCKMIVIKMFCFYQLLTQCSLLLFWKTFFSNRIKFLGEVWKEFLKCVAWC